MPAADSRAEQIMVALEEKLKSIAPGTPDGFHYRPDVVLPVDEPLLEHFDPKRAGRVLYLLFFGDDERDAARTTGTVDKEMEVGIVAARRADVDRKSDDPYVGEIPRARTVRNRLIQDIEKALRADVTLGGLCWEIDLAHRNRQYYVQGWDAVHVPFTVKYIHPRRTP
jgi:hypothetical protein